jgi:peptide/nickel transport system substrate-binding protein
MPSKYVHGGVVRWAEAPSAVPNWIFPFADLAHFSVANLTQFQYLMYRPLYWFGQVTTPAPSFDEQLSLASAPTFSSDGLTATIKLKGWKFSNGQTIDAQSVIFWMNMMKAEKANWAGYAPGYFPDNVASYSASSPNSLTVTMKFNKKYSQQWLLYNEISMITPMPEAWDVTSLTGKPGSGGCGKMTYTKAVAAACKAVWSFDTDDGATAKNPVMSANTGTYATNPLWKVVDGPWKLSQFQSSGYAVFVPNPSYSGSQQPILKKFIELPYTDEKTEYADISANGSKAPNVGYIPEADLPANPGPVGSTGPNSSRVSANYNLVPVYSWSINYFPENFKSTAQNGAAGKIFNQLYIRQALQDGVDQTGMIHAYLKGYGVPTYGPVPVYPDNPFATTQEKTDLYPFSLSKGTALLTAHGWKVNPGGTDTCQRPGTSSHECGAGIPAGAQLSFTEVYAQGTATTKQMVEYEQSSWLKMGINVSLKAEPFDQVLGVACQKALSSACDESWTMANWGGGWIYSPDYLPTGEEIFASTAGSNTGFYQDPHNDALIRATTSSNSSSAMADYERYLQVNLPVVWQPNPAYQLAEIQKNLHGVTPVNTLLNLTPEYWYYTKG